MGRLRAVALTGAIVLGAGVPSVAGAGDVPASSYLVALRPAAGDSDVFAWRRAAGGSTAVVAVNFTAAERRIRVPRGDAVRAVAGTHLDPPAPDADGGLTLRPFEGVILTSG